MAHLIAATPASHAVASTKIAWLRLWPSTWLVSGEMISFYES